MHLLPLINIVGLLTLLLGSMQLIPLALALAYGESDWVGFLYSAVGAMAAGSAMWFFTRKATDINERDGFGVVTLGWVAAVFVGGVPYMLTGTTATITDAAFESMAGFTTTGSTVLDNLESLGHGVLLWRSMTQWFGGMGIIVLALVILPALGIGGMQLYKREVPGPSAEKLTPRIRDTARALWSVYMLLTVAQAIALVLAGMPVFDAINHALTTLSTAGFSTRDGSVGAYNSATIEWIIIFFMMAAGTNYFLHFRAMFRRGQQLNYFRDPEWRWYAFGTALASLVMAAYLIVERGYAPFQALTKGTFQVVSVLTTTGYGSDDFELWGPFPMMLLFALMITGGCAGSTGGGVKWVRIVLMMKFIRMEVLRLIHPRLVVHAKFGHTRVTPDILGNIFAFIFLYMTTLGVTTLLLTLDGNSILTAIGSAASALGNVGPGFDATGPSTTYASLSDFSKWVLTMAMMMGRLELMTVFALFMPHTWRV